MKCPECGKEMERGWVYSRGVMFWSSKAGKIWKIPGRKSTILSSVGEYPEGYICKDCHKIILEY